MIGCLWGGVAGSPGRLPQAPRHPHTGLHRAGFSLANHSWPETYHITTLHTLGPTEVYLSILQRSMISPGVWSEISSRRIPVLTQVAGMQAPNLVQPVGQTRCLRTCLWLGVGFSRFLICSSGPMTNHNRAHVRLVVASCT